MTDMTDHPRRVCIGHLSMPVVAGVLLAACTTTTADSGPQVANGTTLASQPTSCPPAPHCVSTQDVDNARAMPALKFSDSAAAAQARLKAIVASEPRTEIAADIPGYLKTTFRSRIFGFVDDVEFWIDPPAKAVRFRSSSRIGYYDFGVNRARMEAIVKAFTGA